MLFAPEETGGGGDFGPFSVLAELSLGSGL
jgi:hypothetical protein